MAAALATPTVVPTSSESSATVGDTLTGSVAVGGTGGAQFTGTWYLLGPVAAGSDNACDTADWNGATTLDIGSFDVSGDGTYALGQSDAIKMAGCYSYTATLPSSHTTNAAGSNPGGAGDTTLVDPQVLSSAYGSGTPGNGILGNLLYDNVTIFGVDLSDASSIAWSEYGPVAPGPDGSCARANWSRRSWPATSSRRATNRYRRVTSRPWGHGPRRSPRPGATPSTCRSTADGTYQPASLSLGQSDDTVDVDPIYAVSGTVWYDENGNGIEPNPLFSYLHVERLPVSLYTASGQLVTQTVTDGTGNYTFDNLGPGSYFVHFANSSGGHTFVFARQNAPGSNVDTASDADAAGDTNDFTLAPPSSSNTVSDSAPTDGVDSPYIVRNINAGVFLP